jgi:hypothetical protein
MTKGLAFLLAPFRQTTPAEPALDQQVEKLLLHAAEHRLLVGADPEAARRIDSDIVAPLVRALQQYKANTASVEARAALLIAYGRLMALTGEVTGRAIIDSQNCGRFLHGIGIWTLVSATAAISLEVARGLTLDVGLEPSKPLGSLTLFAWGALGSCVYLMKTLSDRIEQATFDQRYLQGWRTRILLGAILGALLPRIFDLGDGSTGLNVSAVALALLAGMGVKVVYGALENLIESLAPRLTLDVIRRAPAPVIAVAPQPRSSNSTAQAPGSAERTTHGDGPSLRGISAIGEIQQLLTGLGRYSGPIDGTLNPATVDAIVAFLNARPDQRERVKTLDPAVLAGWLRAGKAPDDWSTTPVGRTLLAPKVLTAEEAEANRRMLRQLRRRAIIGEQPDTLDTAAVENEVAKGIKRLLESNRELAGKSFTELLTFLEMEEQAASVA